MPEPIIASFSEQGQWIYANLISNDQQINAKLEQYAKDWAEQDIPIDGRVHEQAESLVNEAIKKYQTEHPEDETHFTEAQRLKAASITEEDIKEQVRFLHNESGQRIEGTTQGLTETQRQPEQQAMSGPVAQPGVPTGLAKREVWPKVNFPNSFVQLFDRTAKDGRVSEMMNVTIPRGTSMNGVDIGGWHFDRFAHRQAKEDKINGRPVTVAFRPGDNVELWRGAGEQRQTLAVTNTWDLCKAVKNQRETYKHEQQQKRLSGNPQPEQATRQMVNETVPLPLVEDVQPVPDVISERGEFMGDGIPRTAGGYPYEPLSGPTTQTPQAQDKSSVFDGIKQRAEHKINAQTSLAAPTLEKSHAR